LSSKRSVSSVQPELKAENLKLETSCHLARIELGPAEISRFLNNGITGKVAEALKKIGYAHVTLDLQGYRRGSVNEALAKSA